MDVPWAGHTSWTFCVPGHTLDILDILWPGKTPWTFLGLATLHGHSVGLAKLCGYFVGLAKLCGHSVGLAKLCGHSVGLAKLRTFRGPGHTPWTFLGPSQTLWASVSVPVVCGSQISLMTPSLSSMQGLREAPGRKKQPNFGPCPTHLDPPPLYL